MTVDKATHDLGNESMAVCFLLNLLHQWADFYARSGEEAPQMLVNSTDTALSIGRKQGRV